MAGKKKSGKTPAAQGGLKKLYNRKIMVDGIKYHVGETTAAYTLLLPTIITLFVLFVLPLVMLIVLSFMDYRMTTGVMKFNGIENYLYLLRNDDFWQSMQNTLVFAFVKLGLDLFIALAVALALDSRVWFRKIMRTIYFSPVVTPRRGLFSDLAVVLRSRHRPL